LRADAAYQLGGGDVLRDARRLYRLLATTSPDPAEQAWARFAGGSIDKGLGLIQEAETEFSAALAGEPGPWAVALEFNLAVLYLETSRYREAGAELDRWLERHPEGAARPLALFLAGECAARRNDDDRALLLFGEARRRDASAWTVRPETGHVFADLLLRRGQKAGAVELLEQLATAAAGTAEAGAALLRVGGIWADSGEIARAANAYARLLDQGATPAEGREARLRLALLGVEHADAVELTEPYPAYRLFYRPRPTLEEFVAGRDPLAAQRALRGLATLEHREGRVPDALALLARVFLDYPETPQSGQAYENYMDGLERYLAELLREGAVVPVIEQYLVSRRAMIWAPTRDIGSLLLYVAQAYERVGAPGEAREVYRQARNSGTRSLSPQQLDERILHTLVLERDVDALRRWVAGHPGDRSAHVDLAMALVRLEKPEEARTFLLRAEKLSRTPAERLEARSQSERLETLTAGAQVLLRHLEERRALWSELPQGEERSAWDRESTLTEARLRFAVGDYAVAADRYAVAGPLPPADTYLLAVAQARRGQWNKSLALFQQLTEGDDPVYRELAARRRRAVELAAQVRGNL